MIYHMNTGESRKVHTILLSCETFVFFPKTQDALVLSKMLSSTSICAQIVTISWKARSKDKNSPSIFQKYPHIIEEGLFVPSQDQNK